jgi:uncharacterized membrane protein YbhN (UPF0104 family)
VKSRSVVFFAASIGLAGILLAYLWTIAGLQSPAAGRVLAGFSPHSVIAVVILLGLNSFLAGERWRLAERQLGGDAQLMPRPAYFAWTALGTGFGQIIPSQLSLAMCRSIGLRLYHGRGLLRGTTVTVFEQFYDVVVAGLVAVGSVLTLLIGGGGITWLTSVFAAFATAFVLYIAGRGFLARLAPMLAHANGTEWAQRLRNMLVAVVRSGLLSPGISWRLFALSLARFAGFVLLAAVSAQAAELHCPIWELAAVQPFGVLGNALAITPGGLGVNEWATTSALFAFGIPFQFAALWAVLNRALVAFAAIFVAAIGALVLVALRWSAPLHAR